MVFVSATSMGCNQRRSRRFDTNRVTFVCFGEQVTDISGAVATIVLTGTGPGDSELQLVAGGPFITGLIFDGQLVGQGNLGSATVSVAEPEPTATPIPEPTATAVPEPTATPIPEPTATPEPGAYRHADP